jgi:hypothetical protein
MWPVDQNIFLIRPPDPVLAEYINLGSYKILKIFGVLRD